MSFKPMLAVDHDPKKLVFPCFASPKLDGLRGLVHEGKLLSRSLKSIPNRHVSTLLSAVRFNGLDGELVAGSPTAPDCMQACTSFFMAQDKVRPDWAFHVFDMHDCEMLGYDIRHTRLVDRYQVTNCPNIVLHTRRLIADEDELMTYEAEQLALGYEGLILRKPDGHYKYGRSTVNEGLLLKVKRFSDSDFEILGFEEQMFNGNKATTNELGRTKRSSHKAGKSGKATLGAFLVRDVSTGVEFSIGTGIDDALRAEVWANRPYFLGKFGKYKSFPIGVKLAPRHPVFLAFRDARDMS